MYPWKDLRTAMAIKRLRDLMTGYSKLRYLIWRARSSEKPITIKFKTSERLILRQGAAEDLGIAYEVFVAEAYKLPQELETKSVHRIVDVGSNVGYTCLYWLARFPQARVTAFEPHPVHVDLIRSHLEINNLKDKVVLHPAAAGAKEGQTFLTDDGGHSSTTLTAEANTIAVPQVDWFTEIGSEPIDILKLDIEGGEYELLRDARFSTLRISMIVMEWHTTREHPEGAEWCLSRLQSLGYSTMGSSNTQDECGMIWAFRT
jgi:FkbM family methyltransferase